MAHGILFLGQNIRKRLAKGWIVEVRVVAKAAVTASYIRDLALNLATNHNWLYVAEALGENTCDCANESCALVLKGSKVL